MVKQIFFIKDSYQNLLSNRRGDIFLETQLLFGEIVFKSPPQPEYIFSCEQTIIRINGNRTYYPGHISDHAALFPVYTNCCPTHTIASTCAVLGEKKLPLSFGTLVTADNSGNISLPDGTTTYCDPVHLRPLSQNFSVETLITDAQRLIGFPYVWGGRFLFKQDFSNRYGVDCSGFLNLLFRAQNISIPRNSIDQFKNSTVIRSFDELSVGGAIFLAENQTNRITHVMLKTGEDTIIDASKGAGKVRVLERGRNFKFSEMNMHLSYNKQPNKVITAFFGDIKKHPFDRVF
ncbi:MAG: NlpC/P60 family protein [Victivallaceae bacterium]